jgi:hypothetical protein
VLGLQKLTWYQSLVSEGDQIRQDIFVATQEILIIASLQVVGKTQKLKKRVNCTIVRTLQPPYDSYDPYSVIVVAEKVRVEIRLDPLERSQRCDSGL